MLDWEDKADYINHKPRKVDKIPDVLKPIGKVFFPIPREKKGYKYPHHLDEFRYYPDSEKLNAYFEQGWGYGISCAGDLAVVDIDDSRFANLITSRLPETSYQISGSRSGYHLFYKVPGLDSRVTLYYKDGKHVCESEQDCWPDEDGECVREYTHSHLGEVKCDPHGYVVGPGSVHPSGNKYELVHDAGITEVNKEKFLQSIEEFTKDEPEVRFSNSSGTDYSNNSTSHPFYDLTAEEVMPALDTGERISHPVHGSTTGSNFMKNDDGETFTCWRCKYGKGDGCGLSGTQYLACEATNANDCSRIRRYWGRDSTLHYRAWKEAVRRGLVSYESIPYKVAHGYAVEEDIIERGEKLNRDHLFDIKQQIRALYEMQEYLEYIEENGASNNT